MYCIYKWAHSLLSVISHTKIKLQTSFSPSSFAWFLLLRAQQTDRTSSEHHEEFHLKRNVIVCMKTDPWFLCQNSVILLMICLDLMMCFSWLKQISAEVYLNESVWSLQSGEISSVPAWTVCFWRFVQLSSPLATWKQSVWASVSFSGLNPEDSWRLLVVSWWLCALHGRLWTRGLCNNKTMK